MRRHKDATSKLYHDLSDTKQSNKKGNGKINGKMEWKNKME